jgi:hypothetical protein
MRDYQADPKAASEIASTLADFGGRRDGRPLDRILPRVAKA